MLLAGLPEWFLKSIRESLFYRGLFPHVDLLIFMKMTFFLRAKGPFFYVEKWHPVMILRGSLFCFTQAMVTSLYKRNIFEWDVKQSLIINQLISQSIYQYINQILTPHLRVFLDEHRILIAVFGNTVIFNVSVFIRIYECM